MQIRYNCARLCKWYQAALCIYFRWTTKGLFSFSGAQWFTRVFSWRLVSELKKPTFLSHGRKPEVNISQARILVSPKFSNTNVVLCKQPKQEYSRFPVRKQRNSGCRSWLKNVACLSSLLPCTAALFASGRASSVAINSCAFDAHWRLSIWKCSTVGWSGLSETKTLFPVPSNFCS